MRFRNAVIAAAASALVASGGLAWAAYTGQLNIVQWAGTAITNTPTAVGTAGTGNTPTFNSYIVGCTGSGAPCNANGQGTMTASSPVVIASDQSAVAVKTASGAIASGALASGSISSGAAVSGAFVAGAIADLAHGQGTMAASVPVAIASDQSAVATKAASGAFASGSIASGAVSSGAIASGAVASGAFASGAIGSGAIASGAIAAGASAGDPCTFGTKVNLAISSNATALTQIIAASGSTKIYICSIALIAPGATAINLNTGTGSNCVTGTAALIGSTTAANGMSLAANGGFTLGNGGATVAVTAASSEICTLQSNAVQVAGSLTYVQQ